VGTGRRTQIARAAAALAVVVAAVAIAIAVADRRSEDAIDVPAGGLPQPEPDPGRRLDIVIDEPAGGREPRGLVWVLCCGAWRPPETYGIDLGERSDRAALGSLAWARRGYLAASFAAHGEETAVDEAVAAYDRLRAEHPGLEICAVGGSAAGHMALMVAARRPDLRCVAAHSAPSALADLPPRPIPGVLAQSPLSLALEVFGRRRLDELSPLRHAGAIRASVRLAACSADRIVPPSQSRRLARALRRDPAAEVELALIRGESVRRRERPPRGTVHLVHECFATERRVEADQAGTVAFVERVLGEL
jgi:dienelactone hydrolase